MITISNSSIIEEIKQRLPIVEAYQRYIGGNLKKDGNRFVDHCFIHSGDSNASFTIHTDTNRYCCYGCNVNGDVVDLVAAYKGIDNKAAIKFLRDDLGIVDAPKQATVPQKAVTYDYKDKDGNLLYQVVRKYKDGKKTFIQRQPDGSGKWSYNLKGIEPIPYKLPELLGAIQRGEAVYIVEGEKDVDSLTAAGLTATCNSGGAGKWKSVYSQYFQSNTRVIILPDNDEPGREHSLQVADALHKRGCLVKIVELPGLPLKGDVTDWLQAGNTVEQLISLVDSAELWKPTGQSEPSPGDEPNKDDEPHKYQEWKDLFKGTSYTVNKNGCLCVLKPDKDNPKINKVVPMANFTARITKEVVKDDGQETKFMFEIDGILVFGKKLSTINVPSTKFNSLCWVVENWGAAANIIPGAATKDSLRHAIQTTGERCKRETIFTHTGWRKIGGSWAYLHGGGAIGAAAVTVDLEEAKLTRYSLPVIAVASESRRAAALTSLECLQLAPEEITLPLLATVYLSPLCEPMRQAGCEPSFLLWLSGMTGARKSTLAGLFLSHYGQFTGKDLPGSFKDTENTLERKAFLLKDTVFCVDDYHPVGSPQEKRRMEKTAHGIIRGYGDRVGRGRMNADTSLKESFVPRGLCIVTGEDVPNLGQSATARLLTLDLKRGDVDLNKLSAMQAKSYLLSECMAGYIDWLRPRISTIAANTKEIFPGLRQQAATGVEHGRIPETATCLYIGYVNMLSYFAEVGAITMKEKNSMTVKAWETLMSLSEQQGRRIHEDAPAEKFISALKELMTAGQVIIRDVSSHEEGNENGAENIGWKDDLYYYLLPGLTYKAVCQFYQQQGGVFSVGENTLWKHIEAAGMITIAQEGKQVRRAINKRIPAKGVVKVIHLKTSAINL